MALLVVFFVSIIAAILATGLDRDVGPLRASAPSWRPSPRGPRRRRRPSMRSRATWTRMARKPTTGGSTRACRAPRRPQGPDRDVRPERRTRRPRFRDSSRAQLPFQRGRHGLHPRPLPGHGAHRARRSRSGSAATRWSTSSRRSRIVVHQDFVAGPLTPGGARRLRPAARAPQRPGPPFSRTRSPAAFGQASRRLPDASLAVVGAMTLLLVGLGVAASVFVARVLKRRTRRSPPPSGAIACSSNGTSRASTARRSRGRSSTATPPSRASSATRPARRSSRSRRSTSTRTPVTGSPSSRASSSSASS